MKSNLPEKYDKGIFYKIKNFFLRLLKKEQKEEKGQKKEDVVVKQENESENTEKNSIKSMKKEYTKSEEQEKLLKQIEADTSLIDNWPTEKLVKLEKIYDKKIAEYDREIARLIEKTAS